MNLRTWNFERMCWPCKACSTLYSVRKLHFIFWSYQIVYTLPNVFNFVMKFFLAYSVPEDAMVSVIIIPIVSMVAWIAFSCVMTDILREVVRIDSSYRYIRDMRQILGAQLCSGLGMCILDIIRFFFWKSWSIALVLTQLIFFILSVGTYIIFLDLTRTFFVDQSQIRVDTIEDLEFNEAQDN